jgi:DNA-binding transcriptional LysR family regulator
MNYQVYLDLSALKALNKFTLAAESRGCIQSTLSRRLLAEETALECILFDRKTHELTFAGKLYLKYGVKLEQIRKELA